jgi:hypothetical protein
MVCADELRCSGIDSKGKCTYCAYSYINASGGCQEPAVRIDGCYSYESETKCLECFWGYLKKRENTCVPLTAKNLETCFVSYVSTTSCSHCLNSVLTTNGKCSRSRKCSDKYCEVCYMLGSSEACYICKQGYMMLTIESDYICVPQTAERAGCYWTDSYDDCKWCDYGYYYSGNKTCLPTEMTAMFRKYVGRWEILNVLLLVLMYFPPQ